MPDAAAVDRSLLSAMGLYSDIAAKEIAPDLIEFEPAHALWSDGASKRRWIALPPGSVIDTSDMDRWRFPIGTRLFKEFSVDGRRIETRLIERTGPGAYDFDMVAYLWREDESDADRAPAGAQNALGTDHDVPSTAQCGLCHHGEPGRIIGFSAVQLDHQGDPNVASLAAAGLLSAPPAAGVALGAPGAPEVAAALGVLHANCGHCHNPAGAAWPDTQMQLRLEVADRSPEETTIVQSTVDVPLDRFQADGYALRIESGSPETSAIVYRMASRGAPVQMPPLATEVVDQEGLAVVEDWIRALPP